MPFKSSAQREKWKELLAAGKITQESFDRREKETGNKKLPERAPKKRTKIIKKSKKK